jgi:hypothetical protein
MSFDHRLPPSRAGAGLLILIATPLCLVGLTALGVAARALVLEQPDWEKIGSLSLLGAIAGGAGCGLMALGRRRLRRWREEPAPPAAAADAPPDLDALGIRVAELASGGREFHLAACRNKGAALQLLVFFLLFAGATAMQVRHGAPLIFPIAFLVFEVLLLIGILDLFFSTSQVAVEHGILRLRSGLFGGGVIRELAAAEIDDVRLGIGMRFNSTAYYDVEVVPRSGRKLHAARHIRHRGAAEQLAGELMRLLGLPGAARGSAAAEPAAACEAR